jgi:hypothetical protein
LLPRSASYEDSRTTADIYEQDIDDSDHAVSLLENFMGCDLAEAHECSPSAEFPSRDEKGPPRRTWKRC